MMSEIDDDVENSLHEARNRVRVQKLFGNQEN